MGVPEKTEEREVVDLNTQWRCATEMLVSLTELTEGEMAKTFITALVFGVPMAGYSIVSVALSRNLLYM